MSVVPASTSETPPAGSRQLGVRVKPIIRLGMGYRDEQRKGAPVKTDYLTVRGDDRAVQKFRDVRGEKPKSVEMLLPASIDQALTIQYRAFKGADGDGSLVAVGHTNFALRDYCGGPDVLTVWNQDGSVEQVETLGLDANTREPLDEIAKDLGLELYTTLRAGMPDVLGFGSFFEISTKGKQSTDNLWAKLRELYELFGSRVTFAVKPLLVIRPSTARPVVRKDGETKRIKTSIFVLDVVVSESIDEMLARLADRQALLAPNGAREALYGPAPVAQIGPGDVEPEPEWEQVDDVEVVEGTDTDEVVESATADTDDGPPVGEGSSPFRIPAAARQADEKQVVLAAQTVIPETPQKGKTLEQLAGELGSDDWLAWAVRRKRWPKDFRAALELYVAVRHPDIWQAFQAEVQP